MLFARYSPDEAQRGDAQDEQRERNASEQRVVTFVHVAASRQH